jgi:CDP-diacylglycerol--glycerol-3-phosphate 3-phosphatidyltransferase
MIVRDTVVDASRIYAASKGKVVAADIFGKLKTIFQMLGIIVILFLFNENSSSVYY